MDPRLRFVRRVDGGAEFRIRGEDLAAMGPKGLQDEIVSRGYDFTDLGEPGHKFRADVWSIPILRGRE